MFDDEDKKPKAKQDFPRDLEKLSIEELKQYVSELDEEKQRVQNEINRKDAHKNAASAFFK